MVKQAKTTKRVNAKTTAKKPVKKTAVKRSSKSVKADYRPNMVALLVSTSAVLILFSLAFIVTM